MPPEPISFEEWVQEVKNLNNSLRSQLSAEQTEKEEKPERFWIDNNPIRKPFGDTTYGIVDLKCDKVIVYVGNNMFAQFIQALLTKNVDGMPFID